MYLLRFIAVPSALLIASTAAAQERIAYESDGDILVLEVATGVVTNVTSHAALDAHPGWSPDGTRIVFVSNRTDVPGNADGNLEVFTMSADGTDVVQVTDSAYPFPGQAGYDHYNPAYSPDAAQIAYEWDGPTGSNEIYISNADGTSETLLTDPLDFASKYGPDWSPDGGSLIYTWGFGYLSGLDIHVIAADGTGETSLSEPLPFVDERNPRWSPDGTRIVYETNVDGNDEIYVMNADGSNVTQVTVDPAIDVEPSWSPDGLEISFSSTRDGTYEIYVIEAPPYVDEPPVEEPAPAARLARVHCAHEEPVTQLTFGGDAHEPSWTEGEFVAASFVLTVKHRGNGGVLSVPAGIWCGSDCSETLTAGTVVVLKAKAKPGSVFTGWSGGCSGVGKCLVTMDRARSVKATFTP